MPTKLTALIPPITSPAYNALMYIVNNPLAAIPVSSGMTVQNLFAGVINVKQYGAVGNGIVDDTVAINAAKTALLTAGGGALYFPAGLYRITSTILFDLTIAGLYGVEVYGCSGKSKIYYTPADGTDCFRFFGMTILLTTLHIHDMAFIGAGFASATGNAIRLQRCVNPTQINNVTIEHFGGGAGIYIESSWMVSLISIWAQENKYGVQSVDDPIAGPYGSTLAVILRGCHLQSSSSYGYYGNTNHLTIDTCIIEANEGGIYLNHARHIDIINTYFEQNFGVANDKYDIDAIHSPYISIRQCTGSTRNNVHTDVDSVWLINEENEFASAAADVVLNGLGVRNIVSNITGGTGVFRNHESLNSITYFGIDDATPSVAPSIYGYKIYITQNANPTTITIFHDGYDGQEIWVKVRDAFTTFDFTPGGAGLIGNDGVDYAASDGDMIHAICLNVGGWDFWHCTIIKI